MGKSVVLVVDDDKEEQKMLSLLLKNIGSFDVEISNNGFEALKILGEMKEPPSLILSDIDMPEMDGIELCRRLRSNPVYSHIPIVFYTCLDDISTKLQAWDVLPDDYVVKGSSPLDLIGRINWRIKWSERMICANPLTKLPGNTILLEKFNEYIDEDLDFAVMYIDINNFKAYNDIYGFKKGDEVIKKVAFIIFEVVNNIDVPRQIIHLGGDDFVVIIGLSDEKRLEEIGNQIISNVREVAPSFYSKEDREREYIIAKDREGNIKKFSFFSVSIGVVINSKSRRIYSLKTLSRIAAELKNKAKTFEGGGIVFDRRKTSY